ncbi:MAG: hypothetical protein RL326_183, partial [Pseudomonadota bacterium]
MGTHDARQVKHDSSGEKVSPWAELIVKESLPLAPKDGSLQAKAEFLEMLTKKLQAAKDFERMDP